VRRGRMADGIALARRLLDRVGVHLPLQGGRVLRAALIERIRLRLRGLRYVPRSAAEVPTPLRQKVDLLYSTAGGIAFMEPVAGKALQFRFLRLALDAGESRRIILALGMEIGYAGTGGVAAAKRVEEVVSFVGKVVARDPDPGLAGFATCCEGLALFLMGRWRDARRCMDAGLKALRDFGEGLRWEATVGELYLTSVLFYLGETRELARLVPLLLRDAVERGDVYAQHGLRAWRSNAAWLVMDRPREARAHAEAVARERRIGEGFHLQHYFEVLAQAQIDLYEGDAAAAWQRVEAAWKVLSRSYLLRIQSVRIEASYLRARVALASGVDPARIAIARAAARSLEREGAAWARALALVVRAQIAAATGACEAALDGLERAERACATADMALFASALRLRRGELHGGAAGAAWAAEAIAAMREQAIAAPEAMARMVCPRPGGDRLLGAG
jgi:eukaryotic-like serine/threonine-protein kinase